LLPKQSRESKPRMGKPKKTRKEEVNEHEVSLADRLSGVRQPNSGALDHRKGDISLDTFLLDSKETSGSTILINGKDLSKITREAGDVHKTPGLVVTIDQLPYTVEKEWVMIPLSVFAAILERGLDKE